MLKKLLVHPLARNLDIDDPATTRLRRRIISKKPFLRQIYREWYSWIADELRGANGPVLEIGSGAGFLGEHIGGLITSDTFHIPSLSLVMDAFQPPFASGSLGGIAMVNVLHHVCRPAAFFIEAARCVRPGGAIVMVEPWVTGWSRFVFTRLHNEPFDMEAPEWEFTAGGPLSSANSAMPWIIFHRDAERFRREFSFWKVRKIEPFMPAAYLLSGGVSMRTLMPGAAFRPLRAVEKAMFEKRWAMFAKIVLERTSTTAE